MPANDDERFVNNLDDTIGPLFRSEGRQPAELETRMHAPIALPTGSSVIRSRTIPWQSIASLVVVLAFLATLVGIAYQRIPQSGPPDPGSELPSVAGSPYDVGGQDIVYPGPNACIANDREFPSDSDLQDAGMPAYQAASVFQFTTADAGVAASIQAVYFNYLMCWSSSATSSPAVGDTAAGDAAMTYLSDRMRYTVSNWTGFDDIERAAVDSYYCSWNRETVLTEFPLTINGPYRWVRLPDNLGATAGVMLPAFGPEDVYQLADGRYAAIIGTLSSGALLSWLGVDDDHTSTGAGANTEPLRMIIFQRVEGTYVIDESLLISQDHDAEPEWPRLDFTCATTDW